MSEIFDYLKWRGDLSFSKVAFGEVDSVIFSMLSYVDLVEIYAEGGVNVAEGENIKISLKGPTQAITIEPVEEDETFSYFYMILPVRMNEQK